MEKPGLRGAERFSEGLWTSRVARGGDGPGTWLIQRGTLDTSSELRFASDEIGAVGALGNTHVGATWCAHTRGHTDDCDCKVGTRPVWFPDC